VPRRPTCEVVVTLGSPAQAATHATAQAATHATAQAATQATTRLTAWLEDRRNGVARPGASDRADLLAELGRRLRDNEFPALAFWLRPANVAALAALASGSQDGAVRSLARGTVAQFLPGNTPVLGAYTWSLSFLCGNRTALRMSSRTPAAELDTYSAILDLLAERGLAASTTLVTADPDASDFQALAAAADVRLIWGSDATVETIRRLPAAPSCHDVTFGDRQSLAAIAAPALLSLSADKLAALASRFVAEVAWSQHQACSAPRAIIWIGDEQACDSAASRFTAAIEAVDNPLVTTLSAGGHLDRLTWAQLSVAQRSARGFTTLRNGLTLLDGTIAQRSDGTWPAGLITVSAVAALPELAAYLSPSHQTLALFGFSGPECNALLDRIAPASIRRIVPIGASHQFGPVWDGYDLIDELTTKVLVAVTTKDLAPEGDRQ
jgi:hypothetical protein